MLGCTARNSVTQRSHNLVPTVLPRPRIEGVLIQALDSAPVVVMKAPLGAGKSTLLSTVLGQRDDATIFAAQPWHRGNYIDDIITAVRAVRPDFGRRMFGGEEYPDATVLAHLFVNELQHVRATLVLAIDNAEHFAQDEHFGAFFDALAHAAPPAVRLILSGRALPPFALASLLLRGRGVSIPPEALAFSAEELVAAFGATGANVNVDTTERIVNETGGWAAGVTLALARDRLPRATLRCNFSAKR